MSTTPRLHIDGPASIDGQDVDDATVPLWAVNQIRTDGPVTIDVEHDPDDLPVRDRDVLADHLRDASAANSSPAETLDHLALAIAGIDADEWAELRGINRETAEQHRDEVARTVFDD